MLMMMMVMLKYPQKDDPDFNIIIITVSKIIMVKL